MLVHQSDEHGANPGAKRLLYPELAKDGKFPKLHAL